MTLRSGHFYSSATSFNAWNLFQVDYHVHELGLEPGCAYVFIEAEILAFNNSKSSDSQELINITNDPPQLILAGKNFCSSLNHDLHE